MCLYTAAPPLHLENTKRLLGLSASGLELGLEKSNPHEPYSEASTQWRKCLTLEPVSYTHLTLPTTPYV